MPPRNFTNEEEEQIAAIYVAGFSTRAIARAYKLPGKTSIIHALRRQEIQQRSPAERNRLYKIDAHAFDVIDNEEKAYWWGFIYADGSVHRRSLNVTLKLTDKNQLVKLKRFLKSEHPIKEITNNCSNGKTYKAALFFATDRHLINRLRALGIVPLRGKINQVIQHLPKELERHWIRGYFDGDGSARKSMSLAFCGSSDLLHWMRKIFALETGTNPALSISKHSKANIYYLFISGRLQALKVSNFMYQNVTVWMPRKKNVIDNWPLPQKRYRDAKGQYI